MPSYTSSWKSSRARSIDCTNTSMGGRNPWKQRRGNPLNNDTQPIVIHMLSYTSFFSSDNERNQWIQTEFFASLKGVLTFLMMSLMATSFPFSVPTNSSSCSTVSTAVFLRKWFSHFFIIQKKDDMNPPKWRVLLVDWYLCPMLTDTRLSRFRRHHCSTSDVQVALKKALRTFEPEQARKTVASCSLKPVLPPSNSLSDSSTTSHSTLNTNKKTTILHFFSPRFLSPSGLHMTRDGDTERGQSCTSKQD